MTNSKNKNSNVNKNNTINTNHTPNTNTVTPTTPAPVTFQTASPAPTNSVLTERDVAMDMLTSSKASVTTVARALTETTNPQLRETLKNQLTACVNSHYRLSDIAISKGWYNAYADPQTQLKQDISEAKSLT